MAAEEDLTNLVRLAEDFAKTLSTAEKTQLASILKNIELKTASGVRAETRAAVTGRLAQMLQSGDKAAIEDAVTAGRNAADDTSGITGSERGMSNADVIASRSTKTQNFFQRNPKLSLLFGSAAVLGGLAGTFLGLTDGVQVHITNIKIQDSSHINVSFNSPPPPGGAFFHPCPRDSFHIDTSTPTVPDLKGSTLTITQVSDNTVILEASITSVAGTSGSSASAPSADGWGLMTCNSEFGNQLGGTVGDAVKFVAKDILEPTIKAAAKIAGDTLQTGLCAAAPIFCNKGAWVGSAASSLSVVAVALFFVLKK